MKGPKPGPGAGPIPGPSAPIGGDTGTEPDGHDAPPYTTSTGKSQGKVDVIITIGAITFGHSVDSRITVEDLQRLASNAAQLTLEGYWVPVGTKGEAYIGCLCSQDEILVYPSTQEDIGRINEPRTNGDQRMTPKESLKPGKIQRNYLGSQASRETQLVWGDIASVLTYGKYVHVITDGGASPNPGSAGWGAIIQQNGKFAWNFGHCSHATNNAMELCAVIEALRNLPNDTHVWISTDSAYVNRGITEWLLNWLVRNWRNAK
jgi:hypothetical protein